MTAATPLFLRQAYHVYNCLNKCILSISLSLSFSFSLRNIFFCLSHSKVNPNMINVEILIYKFQFVLFSCSILTLISSKIRRTSECESVFQARSIYSLPSLPSHTNTRKIVFISILFMHVFIININLLIIRPKFFC